MVCIPLQSERVTHTPDLGLPLAQSHGSDDHWIKSPGPGQSRPCLWKGIPDLISYSQVSFTIPEEKATFLFHLG